VNYEYLDLYERDGLPPNSSMYLRAEEERAEVESIGFRFYGRNIGINPHYCPPGSVEPLSHIDTNILTLSIMGTFDSNTSWLLGITNKALRASREACREKFNIPETTGDPYRVKMRTIARSAIHAFSTGLYQPLGPTPTLDPGAARHLETIHRIAIKNGYVSPLGDGPEIAASMSAKKIEQAMTPLRRLLLLRSQAAVITYGYTLGELVVPSELQLDPDLLDFPHKKSTFQPGVKYVIH